MVNKDNKNNNKKIDKTTYIKAKDDNVNKSITEFNEKHFKLMKKLSK